jgi:asparagine synthase (glutamine-hydrolysing)
MSSSVETRVPFLDHELVTYILALPPDLKIRNGVTKWVLRKALGDLLPKLITDRTDKIGFATPEKQWLSQPDLKLIMDLQSEQHRLLANYIDVELLEDLLKKGSFERIDDATQKLVFRIICLQNWLNLFFGESLPLFPPAS